MADHSDKQTKAQKTQPANPQVESQQEVPASLPVESMRRLTLSTHPPPPTNPAIQRHILQLQRTMGNQATQRLVGSRLSQQMLQRDPAAVFTGIDIKKAVERNHMMSEKLGWTRHLNDIVTYLADQGYFPQGQSPEPSVFAEGVADFQAQRRNLGTPDGIIGGGTWKQMRQEMGIQPTPEEAEWDLTPPWEKTAVPVEKAGRVAQEDSIRESPDILPDNIIGTLKFNTVVFVTKKGGMDNKWYKLTTNDGKEGWYNGDYVALDPPEPTAELYRIQSGDKPINLVGRWYKSGKRFTEWGQDARFYVGALAYANKGRAGMPSPDDLDSLSAWKDVELIAGNHIWQPSKDFLNSLKGKVSSGSISNEIWETAKSVVSTVLNWAICGGAFIAGLIAGPIIWIKDFVVGLVDLAVMIGKVLKSAVNSDLVIDAVDLWESIKKIDFAELGQHFLDEWNAKSSVGKAFFVGKMVGYIAAEIIFAVLTAGGATAAKWAGKLGSVGRFIASKAPRLAEKVSGVAKALKLSKAEQTAFKTAEKAIEGADDVADAGKLAKGSHIDPEIDAMVERGIIEDHNLPHKTNKSAETRAAENGPHKSPERNLGFSSEQIVAFEKLLAKPLTSGDIQKLGEVWEQVAKAEDIGKLTKSNSRRLFNNQRKRFWTAVRKDPDAMKILTDAGCTFPSGRGTAPVIRLPDGKKVQMTLDHIVERQSDFKKALDASNLRISFRKENTVMLRLLHKMDPFLNH